MLQKVQLYNLFGIVITNIKLISTLDNFLFK